jgi:hypothetical protein
MCVCGGGGEGHSAAGELVGSSTDLQQHRYLTPWTPSLAGLSTWGVSRLVCRAR